ncbi:RNA-directed DNA polymerase, eukaryota, reverse transcriptase zinc-binding domain protein, partial [Tanacetum coccineum]
MCKEFKQKELRNFIAEEKIQVCAILETHLKAKNINKACDFVFGRWRWISNVNHSPTSCRIVVGWNVDEVDIMVIQSSSQTVLCLVEILQTKVKFFVSFVYASNSGIERRSLWSELLMHKYSVSNKAWVLMGDSNVTLKPEEHSNGSSSMSTDMSEFKDAVNKMEVEDLCSTGFQYTWTKSLKNANCGILKKLDKIMVNDDFLLQFEEAHDGNRVEGRLVNDQFVSHFQKFLGTSTPVSSISTMGEIAINKISEAEANEMVKDVSNQEIKDALFDIDSSKAAGPDGFTSCFFKKAWSIIETDICLAIKEFFSNGKILGEVNATLIALVPKLDTPLIRIKDGVDGFFKGGRGLRQGDPISPYLFTLVMEVFNLIMIQNIREDGQFKYHYGCRDLKLTHLCFADDLMVLCNGDINSLKVVKKSLEDFSRVSGLFPTLNKSTTFFGSINEKEKEDILGIKDCKCLLDSVENRINCWRNKFLSYAGRIQLIASVLSTMHQYWASVYILPLTVVGKARVAWKIVCRPKEQGGLRFKPLHKWNEVLLVSQLWKLIDKRESLWVKWVNTMKLKGKSIWEVDTCESDSHGWKELMKIREKIKPYVIYKVGDGKSISVWHDKWCDIGPLDSIIQSRDIYDIRMSNLDCLADAIINGRWKWAEEWKDRYPEISQITVPSLTRVKDKAQWLYEGNKVKNYSTRNAWITLRDSWPKVDWCKVVWFSQCSPKQAIILWMAIQKKLLTQDRMIWIQNGSLKCALCSGCPDSHDHLFFDCPYSKKVWDKIKAKGKMGSGTNSLCHIVNHMAANPHRNKIWQVVNNLIISSTVYHIWLERNRRIFQNQKRTEDDLLESTVGNITDMLKCLRVKKSKEVISAANQWNLKWDKERLIYVINELVIHVGECFCPSDALFLPSSFLSDDVDATVQLVE